MIKLEMSYKNFKYRLEFSGKYNFLTGNSAIKKSLILTVLDRYEKNLRSVSVSAKINGMELSKENIIALNNNSKITREFLLNKHNSLIIMDELCDILRERDIASILKDSNNYFLIISRKLFGWLPISVDSIYTLKNINGVFKNIPIYCSNNSELTNILCH